VTIPTRDLREPEPYKRPFWDARNRLLEVIAFLIGMAVFPLWPVLIAGTMLWGWWQDKCDERAGERPRPVPLVRSGDPALMNDPAFRNDPAVGNDPAIRHDPAIWGHR
jgi:hypothetical protein